MESLGAEAEQYPDHFGATGTGPRSKRTCDSNIFVRVVAFRDTVAIDK